MLYLLVSIRFQVLFHSPPGVLFTFPSQYYTLSVTRSYLALRDGPRIFPQDSSCPVVLRILLPIFSLFQYVRLCYRQRTESSTPSYITISRFGLFPFRSPLLGESFAYFLFLRVLRCFSSPGSPCQAMCSLDNTCPATGEFPHSDICGSRLMCSSPQLFAACHVLLRRLVPRHPPYALCSLIVFFVNPISDLFRFLSYCNIQAYHSYI